MSSKIMIVEDEMIIARDIKGKLESLGYDVIGIVSTGEEAINKARESKPDLILMDIELAGKMDGIDASKQIINELDISVIYLTAYSDSKTFRRAIETEPINYLVKPIDEEKLESAIETALFQNKISDDTDSN